MVDPAAEQVVDPRKHVLYGVEVRRAQWWHARLAVTLPLLLLLAGPLYLPAHVDVGLAAASFMLMGAFVGCLGISVGFHRHFAHRAFRAAPWLRVLMGVAGQMAGQGPVLYWTALHRRHHSLSDQPGDPHSPSLRAHPKGTTAWQAFWHSQFRWASDHAVPMPRRYVADLQSDPLVQRVSRAYYLCMAGSYLLPALLGLVWGCSTDAAIVGLYFGGVVRMVVATQAIWAINSVCHRFGARPHGETGDFSTNNAWLCWITFGECWHNNHHHAPTHARFGHGWWQPDPGWWTIAVLRRLGAVWDVLCTDRNAGQRGGHESVDLAQADRRP